MNQEGKNCANEDNNSDNEYTKQRLLNKRKDQSKKDVVTKNNLYSQ